MKICLVAFAIVLSSCASSTKEKHVVTFDTFMKLEIGRDTKETVEKKLRSPDERVKASQEGAMARDLEQWVYQADNLPKLSMLFASGVLQSVSQSIWDDEPESEIQKLLLKFQGNWKVVKEPVTNPHAMPLMCYLLDETSGKRVEIHGRKQKVQSVYKWNPKVKLAKENKLGEKPVFCIGNSCSVLENSKTKWQHNHCRWLEEMLKVTQ